MSKVVSLTLVDIRCSDDTEEGKDELYVMTAGAVNNVPFSRRSPAAAPYHWSIRDNGRLRVVNELLHVALVPDDGLLYAQFIASEEDGQAVADTVKAAADIASKIPLPQVKIPAEIIKAIPLPRNKDDFIGTFAVMVMPDSSVRWTAGRDTGLEHAADDRSMVVHCRGTSTKYWFKVQVRIE